MSKKFSPWQAINSERTLRKRHREIDDAVRCALWLAEQDNGVPYHLPFLLENAHPRFLRFVQQAWDGAHA